MKKLIIFVLSTLLVASCVALNHLTHRLDDAREYINALEDDYPDFIDTTSGTDAYSNWYNY